MKRPTDVLGRTRRAAVATAVAAALAGWGAAPARAEAGTRQQTTEGVQVEVDAGYDGRYLVGRRMPVTVSIEADRLIRGAVEVSIPGQSGTWTTPVEVPGGSSKDVVVVVPTPFGFTIDEISVRLVGAGDVDPVRAEVEPLESEELVGLLPAVTPADLPAPFDFPEEVGTARFEAVTADTLAIAGAIDPLGTLVVGPEELGTLDGSSRSAVLDWVDRGGRLVVDSAPGTMVVGLPDEWQPGETGRAIAGLGEVRQSAGRAGSGDWATVLEPTPTASISEMLRLGGVFDAMPMEAVGDSVARDAGLDALDLPWLLAFLAAYVFLAGPLGFFVLRKRRPGLGWLAIPALAAVFTGLAFVIGSDLRSGTRAAHGTVFETSPAGTRATTVVGTVSRSGGDGRARFPAGWTAGGVDTSFFGPPAQGASGELAVRTVSDGSEATIPLAAGGFGVLRGSGPTAELGDGLTIEAAADGDRVRGVVRNNTPYAIEEIGVFSGNEADRVGTLAPGESAEFNLVGGEFRLGDPFTPPEAEVWPAQTGFASAPVFDSVVNLALLDEAINALGPNARPRGMVTAVGWTRELASPVDVGGQAGASGRSALVARTAVAADEASLPRGAARRELIRGPQGIELPDDDDLEGQIEGSLWRFTLPAGTGVLPLQLDVPAYIARVDVWDGTAWQTIDETPFDLEFNGDFTRLRQVDVPGSARRGDVVLLRGHLVTDFGASDGAGLDLHSGASE